MSIEPPAALVAAPFLSTPEFDIFLLPGDQPQSDMDSLVRRGELSSYRYLDACNQSAFLGFRVRPRHPDCLN